MEVFSAQKVATRGDGPSPPSISATATRTKPYESGRNCAALVGALYRKEDGGRPWPERANAC